MKRMRRDQAALVVGQLCAELAFAVAAFVAEVDVENVVDEGVRIDQGVAMHAARTKSLATTADVKEQTCKIAFCRLQEMVAAKWEAKWEEARWVAATTKNPSQFPQT